ncbi:AAA family ATPase [uncultured Aquimarina sp.]|uniref:AAA family ATPase n=1 Tax=uncultured Aquimarina sp. TaxID=575652 RepID=UPI002621DE5D|nr:AAA family ATPase [uncultured Aquimarina sp.]
MEVVVPENKIYNTEQTVTIDGNVLTFVGENGCGKSAILESIFSRHLGDREDERRLITFSSGNNESFSSIFQKNIRSNQRFIVNNFDDEERVENAINAFYFDPSWVRFLVFFATALKRKGKVIEYLKNKNLVDVNNDGVDITTKLGFPFRVRRGYTNKIFNAVLEEGDDLEYQQRSVRNTFFHQYLTNLTEHIHSPDFDFEERDSRIVKAWKNIEAKDVALVLSTDTNKVFSFLAWASLNNQFIFRSQAQIHFKGGLELNDLSDGEHQLLAIYALVDLFDADQTLFLLDEVDSHLYYQNIKKLWDVFGNIEGKAITTTHSADSIILNEFSHIKLVENGKIEGETVANQILDRLESLSAGGNYKLSMAGKVKYLALVEDYFDWFIFLELCKKKVANFDMNVMQQIHYIKCSSGFNSYADRFGNAKLDWVESFKKQNRDHVTKSLFLICDRDNLSVNDVLDTGLVKDSQATGRRKRIQLRGNKYAYLMSWKRREIENYLLSYTMLNNNGLLNQINQQLAQVNQLTQGNSCDNQHVQDLDVKTMLQPLYLKDGIQPGADVDETGVDYNKLSRIIGEIPVDEISQDIENIYNFIKGKL